MTFDEWYEEFQRELARQSGTVASVELASSTLAIGVIPKGMDKESYRDSYDEGMTPSERAWTELDDLSR